MFDSNFSSCLDGFLVIHLIHSNLFGFSTLCLREILLTVMRMASPVAMHLRVADFGGSFTELPINGVTFLDKCNVEIPIDLLHMHEDYWEEPTKFKPERFLENPNLVKEWFYMPFGAGPRNCVGMRLALLEIRLGLLRILQNFDVQ